MNLGNARKHLQAGAHSITPETDWERILTQKIASTTFGLIEKFRP